MKTNHEIDYKIFGEELQFVEVELDPSETAIAESGAFMMMDNGIEMQTIFGDGSQQQGSRDSHGKRKFFHIRLSLNIEITTKTEYALQPALDRHWQHADPVGCVVV